MPEQVKLKISERDDIADLLALLPINTIFTALVYAFLSQYIQSKGTLPNIFGEGMDWYMILTKEQPGLVLGALLSQVLEMSAFTTQLKSLLEKGVYDPETAKKSPIWTSAAIVWGTIKEVTGL